MSSPFEFRSSELSPFFYHRNLAELRLRWPDLATRIENTDSSHIVMIPEGGPTYQCRVDANWIHGPHTIADECAELRKWLERALRSSETELIYVLGTGLGYMVSEVFRETESRRGQDGTPIALVLLEPRLDVFRAMLQLNDWTSLLSSQRTFLCVGEELIQLCREVRERNHLDACARPVHMFGRPAWPTEQSMYQALLRDIDEGRRRYQYAKQNLQKQLFEQHRRGRTEVRKIWTSVSLGDRAIQHIVRALMRALERKGFEIRILEIDPDSYQPPWRSFMDICSFQPDLLLQANFPSSLLLPREVARTLPIPRVTWYVDNPAYFWRQHPMFFFTEFDHVFVCDEAFAAFARSCKAPEVTTLYFASDLERPGQTHEEYRSPLAFVGQIVDLSESWKKLRPDERTILSKLVDLRLADRATSEEELLASLTRQERICVSKALPRLGSPLPYFLYSAANARRRIRVLESVAQYGLRLYGTDAWITATREDSPLRKCFCGPIEYQTEFPLVCKSADINIGMHSLQAVSCLNMRDFDVPLRDGFLLTDWIKNADSFFVPDEEMVFWHSIDDLKRKIEWFLERPEERERIVERGKARIVRDHTYDARASQLLEALGIRPLE